MMFFRAYWPHLIGIWQKKKKERQKRNAGMGHVFYYKTFLKVPDDDGLKWECNKKLELLENQVFKCCIYRYCESWMVTVQHVLDIMMKYCQFSTVSWYIFVNRGMPQSSYKGKYGMWNGIVELLQRKCKIKDKYILLLNVQMKKLNLGDIKWLTQALALSRAAAGNKTWVFWGPALCSNPLDFAASIHTRHLWALQHLFSRGGFLEQTISFFYMIDSKQVIIKGLMVLTRFSKPKLI